MECKKEEYISLRMTREEASEFARLLSEMIRLLQEHVYTDGGLPPTFIEEVIEDLTWTPLS